MSARDHIGRWNHRYASRDHRLQAPDHIIEAITHKFPPGRALDLACGLGRHALLLAHHGWDVTALDASEAALAQLRESAAARRLTVETKLVDLESSDLTIEVERFDLICDCFYLQRSLITRIQAGVRVGGLVAMALPMVDDDPHLKPMNPDFVVNAGEVPLWFANWEILEYKETKEAGGRRKTARLIAQRSAARVRLF